MQTKGKLHILDARGKNVYSAFVEVYSKNQCNQLKYFTQLDAK